VTPVLQSSYCSPDRIGLFLQVKATFDVGIGWDRDGEKKPRRGRVRVRVRLGEREGAGRVEADRRAENANEGIPFFLGYRLPRRIM
jgi:hypothetical protein